MSKSEWDWPLWYSTSLADPDPTLRCGSLTYLGGLCSVWIGGYLYCSGFCLDYNLTTSSSSLITCSLLNASFYSSSYFLSDSYCDFGSRSVNKDKLRGILIVPRRAEGSLMSSDRLSLCSLYLAMKTGMWRIYSADGRFLGSTCKRDDIMPERSFEYWGGIFG